jgi:glycine/D-amino acid oxidase-like deaminating enzyme
LYGGQFSHHRAALHGMDDQQLYSREAVPALIDYLRRELGVEFHFSTLVRDIEPGRLHSTAGTFSAEQVDDWMLELAEQTLGCKVQVVERWQGVYGSRGPGPFSFLRPMPGVSVALMHTGVGMSVGPALAERNVATLLGDR